MYKQLMRLLVASSIMIIAMAGRAETSGSQWWQLTLHYNATSVTVISAKPFATPKKRVRTPGLEGAPLQLAFDANWYDNARRSLLETTTTLPVGWRATVDSPGAVQVYIPEEGVIVVRLKGPRPTQMPASLVLRRTGVRQRGIDIEEAPRSLQNNTMFLEIPASASDTQPPPGPISATKVRDTGPNSNRLVIAVLGDGYTAADLSAGSFTTHTNILLNAFNNKSPYNIYFNVTNVYRIDIESNESGADEPAPGPGIYKDTYLNSTFWTAGTERLLSINSTGRIRAYAAADSLIGVGEWDDIFVLVNALRYGGSGGSISVSSVHPSSNEIIIHEYGHTFAGLADEYDYGSSSPPDSDGEPNVDFNSARNQLKWNYWVDADTPLPTPQTSTYNDTVGAFLGAKYSTTGIYRPWNNCVMRVLGRPFCPVCKEATVLSYMNLLDLVDTQSPPSVGSVEISNTGSTFTVTALAITPLEYEWQINGTTVEGATGSTFELTPSQLSGATDTLTAIVRHPTALVRSEEIKQSVSWTVTAAPSEIKTEIWSLYK